MSKTVDDLVKVFMQAADDTYAAEYIDPADTTNVAWRAGIVAVIRAVRDEIFDARGNASYGSLAIYDLLNRILGDAGNEKVGTHGSPELDEDARKLEAMGQDPGMTLEELLAPATAPAPAVCVWECGSVPDKKGLVRVSSRCAGFESVRHDLVIGRATNICPSCGLPIKFTEAKP